MIEYVETEVDVLSNMCAEECFMNNPSGIDCVMECEACGEGIDRCPETCLDDCVDCACCFCKNADPLGDLQDFACTIAASTS